MSVGMSEMFAKHPIKLTVCRLLNNDVEFVTAWARTAKRKDKIEGGEVETRYLIIKRGARDFVEIPDLPQKVQTLLESGEKNIKLLQIDKNTYFPLVFEAEGPLAGNLTVLVPQWLDAPDETGQPNKEGKKVIAWARVPFLNFRQMIAKNGEVVPIPYGVSHQAYDALQWLGNELSIGRKKYQQQNWFTKYKEVVLLVLTVAGMYLISMLYLDAFTKAVNLAAGIASSAVGGVAGPLPPV